MSDIGLPEQQDLLIHLREEFLSKYGEDNYFTWFDQVKIVKYNHDNLILGTPNALIQKWIMNNYMNHIKDVCIRYDEKILNIEIVVQDLIIPIKAKNVKAIEVNEVSSNIFSSSLDKRFTYENFVVGKSNELAYIATKTVAESDYAVAKSNPLFLHGGVGLGKTHLMHAMAWHIKDLNPKRRVLYMSAEKFMYEFVKALKTKEIMSFKDYFRSVDVLMIDDIQFICGKDNTQEEFFHTFNALIDNNRQMVISCDRSPSDLDNIEDRIKSRLGWGLVADVHSTTYELRLGILESKIDQINVEVPREVVAFLAEKITSNVRELEGALNKVVAHSSLIGAPITLANTKVILKDLIRSNEKVITIDDIQQKISERYNIKIVDLSSPRKVRSIARPRQIAMYLSKQLTSKSLVEIGKKFGKKDHTTVVHAIKTIEKMMESDKEFFKEVDIITKYMQSL